MFILVGILLVIIKKREKMRNREYNRGYIKIF